MCYQPRQKIINFADFAYKAKDYVVALDKYKKALVYKPDDKRIIKRIAECSKYVSYKNYIDRGDSLFANNYFFQAKRVYQDFQTQYPDKKDLVTAKIAECDVRLNEKHYTEQMKSAEEEFRNKKYEAALKGYKSALQFKPNDYYANEQLKRCEQEIKFLQRGSDDSLKNYSYYVREGDNFFNMKEFRNALASYNKARLFKPNDSYAYSQIMTCQGLLGNNNKYENYMSIANQYFNKSDYKNAVVYYRLALEWSPDDDLAIKRRNYCEREIEKNANYSHHIQQRTEDFHRSTYLTVAGISYLYKARVNLEYAPIQHMSLGCAYSLYYSSEFPGSKIEPYFRFYTKRDAEGLYLMLSAVYTSINFTYNIDSNITGKINASSIGVGGALGYKKEYGNIVLDFSMGLQYLNFPTSVFNLDYQGAELQQYSWYIYGPGSLFTPRFSIGYKF